MNGMVLLKSALAPARLHRVVCSYGFTRNAIQSRTGFGGSCFPTILIDTPRASSLQAAKYSGF